MSILFIPKYGSGYMSFATRPERTVEGTLTGNQYMSGLNPGSDSFSPVSGTTDEDCR